MIVLKHRTAVIIFLSVVFNLSFQANQGYDLVISNVNLIDGSGSPLQKNVNIYIKNNKITKIDRSVIVNTANLIDVSGKFLIHGLFDGHTHPAVPIRVMSKYFLDIVSMKKCI